jgi:hypothetical protein
MRFTILAIITILLIAFQVYGQTEIRGTTEIRIDKIVSDTINLSPNKEFERRSKIKPIDKVDSDVEIRLYKLTSLSNTNNLKILKLKNNRWTAFEYDEWNHLVKINKHPLKAEDDFQSFFTKLLIQNITKLPNQDKLKDKMKKFFIENGRQGERKILVSDGYHYTVELKIGEGFRIYNFSNPDTYANFYDDVEELKHYVAITNLFDKELTRK